MTFPVPVPASLPWDDVKDGFAPGGIPPAPGGPRHWRTSNPSTPRPERSWTSSPTRFVYRKSTRKRVTDSLEQAFQFGKGRLDLHDMENDWRREGFSNRLHCTACDLSYSEPQPNLFSFNSPLGACETCHGFGRVIDLDLDLVIPDPSKSIADGVIKPWTTRAARWELRELKKFCERRGIPLDRPFAELERRGPAPHHRRRGKLARRQVLRHPRLVSVAGAEELQDARPGVPGALPALRHLRRLPRDPAQAGRPQLPHRRPHHRGRQPHERGRGPCLLPGPGAGFRPRPRWPRWCSTRSAAGWTT